MSCFLAFPLGTLHYQSSLLLLIGGTIVFRRHLLYRLTSTSAVPFRSPLLRNSLLPFLVVLRCFSSLLLRLSLAFSLQGICSPFFPLFHLRLRFGFHLTSPVLCSFSQCLTPCAGSAVLAIHNSNVLYSSVYFLYTNLRILSFGS